MTLDLKAMRAKMESKNASTQFQNSSTSSEIFKFGDLKVGDEIRIRFVEDADKTNSFFWRERHSRTLRFDSLLLPNGTTMMKDTYVSVPAFNLKSNETSLDDLPQEYLYKSNEDVIQQKIKGFWIDGDKTSQALYNKFGKKVTYLFQGFVRSPGYETKLYRFVINKELFNLIKTFMTDSEIEDVPCDVVNGRDFILRVSEKNAVINGSNTKVKDYVTNSKWSSKVTPLTAEEMAYLEANESFDLKKYLPKRPSAEQETIMLNMYNASYDGNPYDIKNWASTYRPDNIRLDQDGNVKLKEGEATANLGTEIPQQTANTQPVYQQPQMVQPQQVQQPTWANPMQMQMEQVSQGEQIYQQFYAQPQVMQQPVQQKQVLVDSPVQVQQEPVRQTAPQITSGITETVGGNTVPDTIASIMSKLNMGG